VLYKERKILTVIRRAEKKPPRIIANYWSRAVWAQIMADLPLMGPPSFRIPIHGGKSGRSRRQRP